MNESINGHVRIQSIFALIFHDNLKSLLSHLLYFTHTLKCAFLYQALKKDKEKRIKNVLNKILMLMPKIYYFL